MLWRRNFSFHELISVISDRRLHKNRKNDKINKLKIIKDSQLWFERVFNTSKRFPESFPLATSKGLKGKQAQTFQWKFVRFVFDFQVWISILFPKHNWKVSFERLLWKYFLTFMRRWKNSHHRLDLTSFLLGRLEWKGELKGLWQRFHWMSQNKHERQILSLAWQAQILVSSTWDLAFLWQRQFPASPITLRQGNLWHNAISNTTFAEENLLISHARARFSRPSIFFSLIFQRSFPCAAGTLCLAMCSSRRNGKSVNDVRLASRGFSQLTSDTRKQQKRFVCNFILSGENVKIKGEKSIFEVFMCSGRFVIRAIRGFRLARAKFVGFSATLKAHYNWI